MEVWEVRMRRSATVVALTAVVVIGAGSAAAALNTRVLDAAAPVPVGGLAAFLPEPEAPSATNAAPSPSSTTAVTAPAPVASLTPAPGSPLQAPTAGSGDQPGGQLGGQINAGGFAANDAAAFCNGRRERVGKRLHAITEGKEE